MPTTPYISKINLGTVTYNIKDQWARDQIGNIGSPMHFKGVALQTLTDGGTENAAAASGSSYAGAAGDVYLQKAPGTGEFVWTGSAWELLGDEGSYVTHGTYGLTLTPTTGKVTSTTSYRPAGTVSQPTFTGTAATITVTTSYKPAGTVSQPTFTGSQATITVESTEEFVKDVTTGSGSITLPNGTVSKPTFTGTQATITVESEYTPAGSVSLTGKATDTFIKTASLQGTPTAFEVNVDDNETLILPDFVLEDLGSVNVNTSTGTVVTALTGATFSGTKATITSTGTYTPAGGVSQPTFSWATTNSTKTVAVNVTITPTKATVASAGTYTPGGTVSQPTFSGTQATITSTGTYTPAGTVSQPTFSGTTATITVTSTGNFMSGVSGSVTL